MSNPKCPQYRKPKQQQIFAAQVVDDRSDSGQPNQTKVLEEQGEHPESDNKRNIDERLDEQPEQDIYPDSSQYNNEDISYDDYKGYAPPSENKEPVYI